MNQELEDKVLDVKLIKKIIKFRFNKRKKIKYNSVYKIIKFINVIDFDKKNLKNDSSEEIYVYDDVDIKSPSHVIQIFFENGDYMEIIVQSNIVCDDSEIEERYREINRTSVYCETDYNDQELKQIKKGTGNYYEIMIKRILINNGMNPSKLNMKKIVKIILEYADEYEIILDIRLEGIMDL